MPFWFFALISCSCSFLLKCVKCRHFPLGNGNRLHHHTVEKVFAEPKLYHSWQPLCMRIVRKVCCVLHCSMNKKIHKTRKISDERQNIPLKYSILFATLIISWNILFASHSLSCIHNYIVVYKTVISILNSQFRWNSWKFSHSSCLLCDTFILRFNQNRVNITEISIMFGLYLGLNAICKIYFRINLLLKSLSFTNHCAENVRFDNQ